MNYLKLLSISVLILLAGYFSRNFIIISHNSEPPQSTTSTNTSTTKKTAPLTTHQITRTVPSPLITTQQKIPTPHSSSIPTDQQGRPLYKANQLLVIFNNAASDEEIEGLNRKLGSSIIKEIKHRRLFNLQLRPDLDISKAMKAYNDSGLVKSVGTNNIRYPLALFPDDPSYPKQWNMDIIKAPDAWEVNQGSNATIVAIIDTGVNYRHEDLQANIWTNLSELDGIQGVDDDGNGYIDDLHGWDFGDNDNDPSDAAEHGTHIAGIIGATGNNTVGVAGVNWHVRLMPLKVQSDMTAGFTTLAIVEAIDYASMMGAKVVNCSYGGTPYDDLEYQAMSALGSAGILAVCAAGNGVNNIGLDIDQQAEYPASFDLDNIIAVTASDKKDSLSSYSNYGLRNVDLAAPGDSIFSTITNKDTLASVRLNTTPTIEYAAENLEYSGTTNSNGITGKLIYCGYGALLTDFPSDVQNNIALIARDIQPNRTTTFAIKVDNAAKARALGVIIFDDTNSTLPFNSGTLGTAKDWLPAVTVTNASGQTLKTIPSSQTVTIFNTLDATLQYQYLSGTSMAAPHVTGAAALLYSLNPDISFLQAKEIILNSVDLIPELAAKTVSGGRLNLFKILTYKLGGDVNGDHIVNLKDAILLLRLLSAHDVEFCPTCPKSYADINGDKHFGLEEAIFILHKIVGL